MEAAKYLRKHGYETDANGNVTAVNDSDEKKGAISTCDPVEPGRRRRRQEFEEFIYITVVHEEGSMATAYLVRDAESLLDDPLWTAMCSQSGTAYDLITVDTKLAPPDAIRNFMKRFDEYKLDLTLASRDHPDGMLQEDQRVVQTYVFWDYH